MRETHVEGARAQSFAFVRSSRAAELAGDYAQRVALAGAFFLLFGLINRMRAKESFDRFAAEPDAGAPLTPRAYVEARRPLTGPAPILSVSGFGAENLEGVPYASRNSR